MLTSWIFWKASLERSVKTIAQAAAAYLLAAGVTGLMEINWLTVLSVAGLAGVMSILTSVGSDMATHGTGPSLANEVPTIRLK